MCPHRLLSLGPLWLVTELGCHRREPPPSCACIRRVSTDAYRPQRDSKLSYASFNRTDAAGAREWGTLSVQRLYSKHGEEVAFGAGRFRTWFTYPPSACTAATLVMVLPVVRGPLVMPWPAANWTSHTSELPGWTLSRLRFGHWLECSVVSHTSCLTLLSAYCSAVTLHSSTEDPPPSQLWLEGFLWPDFTQSAHGRPWHPSKQSKLSPWIRSRPSCMPRSLPHSLSQAAFGPRPDWGTRR